MKDRDLLEGKILSNLVGLSTPLMLTAFIQMAYSLTDVAWIGRLSTEAVAAAGQVGFFIWIGNSLMLIPRVGMSVLSSQAYGARDLDRVKKAINNGIWLSVVMGILYGLLLIILRDPLIGFFQLEDSVNRLTEIYMIVIALGMPLFFINPVLSGAYNSLGNSKTPFRINAIGLIVNIVMDPLLIFGWGPFPKLGIRGAAIATVGAQFVVFLVFLWVIYQADDLIKQSRIRWWTFDGPLLGQIFKIGVPPSIQSNVHAGISIILNRYVASYGAMPLAVGSVGSMIESICWMTTEGLAVAITALTGQNYGARLMDRVQEIYRVSMRSFLIIGTIASLVLIVFRYQLFHLFIPQDQDAIALGAVYLFILGFSEFFMAFEIGCTGLLNGVGDTRMPASVNSVLNFLRIPLALVFMPFFGVRGVWIAITISTILKGIILYFVTRRHWRQFAPVA